MKTGVAKITLGTGSTSTIDLWVGNTGSPVDVSGPAMATTTGRDLEGVNILRIMGNNGQSFDNLVIGTTNLDVAATVPTATWSNTAGGLWGTAATAGSNWLNAVVGGGSGNTANFNTLNITADTTVNLDSARTIGNLVFGDTDTSSAAGWTLANNENAGNILTLAGTTPTITVNALGDTKTVTISAEVAGTAGLTKSGTGTLTLSAPNSYTGATTVNNGTLQVSGQPYFNVGRTTTVATGAVCELNNSNNTFTSLMPVSTVTGAGTFRLSGSSTINQDTNGTTEARLTFAMDAGGLIDLQDTSRLTNGGWQELDWTDNKASMNIASGATFDIWDGKDVIIDALTGSGTVDKVHGGNSPRLLKVGIANGSGTFSGTIMNTGGQIAFTKVGSGTQTLSGANSYTGATTVNNGTLQVSGQPYFNVGRTTTVATGAVFELYNSDNTFTTLMPTSTITGAGTFRLSGNSTINQSENGVNGTRLTFAMAAGGLIDLQDTSRLTNGGWQALDWTDNKASMNIASGATFDIWDGINAVKIDALTGSGTVDKVHGGNSPALLIVGVADGSGTFSGTIKNTDGQIAFTKTGSGTQTLSGTNTYTGTTTIIAGTLQIGDGGTTGSLSTSSAITNNGNLTINRINAVTQGTDFSDSAITGSGSLTQAGTGTTTLTGNNSYSGGTVIEAGTLEIIADGNLGDITGILTFGDTSTLRAGAAGITLDAARELYIDGASVIATIDTAGHDMAIDGVIAGNGNLTKTGDGTVTLTGTNIYSGGTTVSGGTLLITSASSLPSGRSLSIGSGGTLILGSGMAMGTSAESVPEPGTLALLAMAGLAGLLVWRRRSK